MDESKQMVMLLRHIKIVLLKIADQMDIELDDAELSIPAPGSTGHACQCSGKHLPEIVPPGAS